MIEFLKRAWVWIVSIPQDKLLHYCIVELAASLVFAAFFIFADFWAAFAWANVIAGFFSIGKEITDMLNPEEHSAEWADLAADFVGLAKVDIIILLLYIGVTA